MRYSIYILDIVKLGSYLLHVNVWNSERVILDYVAVTWFRYLKIEERVAILYRYRIVYLNGSGTLYLHWKNGGGGVNLSTVNENYSHTEFDTLAILSSIWRKLCKVRFEMKTVSNTKM